MFAFSLLFLLTPGTLRFGSRLPLFGREHMRLGLNSHEANPALNSHETDPSLESAMQNMGFSQSTQRLLQHKLAEVGLSNAMELTILARDFTDRPEVFSSLLQSDFGFPPLLAHQTRAVVMAILAEERLLSKQDGESLSLYNGGSKKELIDRNGHASPTVDSNKKYVSSAVKKRLLYKSVIVNEKAQRRRSRSHSEKHDYGLPSNYGSIYPKLAKELDEFYTFMTRPSTLSQDPPIRPATAKVYKRHAKLFFGWYLMQRNEAKVDDKEQHDTSLCSIVSNKEKESATVILDFMLWLRSSRNISDSYEANLLRGLIKLLKFRFRHESESDPTYGEKSFEDIPLIRELRKHHRDANKRQRLSSRSSDEERKWLPWSEYLHVIESIKAELSQLIDDYRESERTRGNKSASSIKKYTAARRKIAVTFQYYLVLAFFACVPDRQRTIRELEIGKSFVKDEANGVYIIKHGSDDYKTGKTYGDRPPLVLSKELVPAIDDFLKQWRPCLRPKTDFLFVQPRTGNPLTQDSVYQIVARSCYKYTGKRTNPHLLRDMIVTHVRDSDASEKELEALALYMGHSIQMQRTSYDRRTLTTKVAPAVELLQSVNKVESNKRNQ